MMTDGTSTPDTGGRRQRPTGLPGDARLPRSGPPFYPAGVSESRPSLLFSASRVINRARSRGAREAGSAVRGGLKAAVRSEGRLLFLVRNAGGPTEARADLAFREATSADGRRYARDIGTDSAGTFRQRLSPWTKCFVVEDGVRFLHASWVTTARAWTSEIKAFISPPVGDAYVYESFTRPETRGRGIYPFALTSICAALADQRVARVWVGVEADNVASIRAIGKGGFENAFELGFQRAWGRVRVQEPTGSLAEQGRTMLTRA